MSRPTPVTRADAEGLSALIGAKLAAVSYHYLPPAEGPAYVGGEDGFDADITAVVLEFAHQRPTTITWAMLGDMEGLAFLDEPATNSDTADATVDASDRDAWRVHRGDAVTSVGGAWQVSGEGCPETLWAVRLGLAAGSIVVALGTADPHLDYMPDELVVVFDESLARKYRPRHVSHSAWGERIAP
jgi:hypothetical protein